ncbi:hypothetical protein ACW73L_04590 [Methylolobus aquaticus]
MRTTPVTFCLTPALLMAASLCWAGTLPPSAAVSQAARVGPETVRAASAQSAHGHWHSNNNSYARLSARWWQWAYSGADGNNSVQDTTGELCGLRQPNDDVWFLAGTFGGPAVVRSCTIPADRKLFYPVVNSIWTDCPGTADEALTDQEVREILVNFTIGGDPACQMSSTLDGIPVTASGISVVRTQSPRFSTYLPKNNLIRGCDASDPNKPLPAGKTGRQIAEGHWVMLPPLRPGKHTLTLHGAGCDASQDGLPFFQTEVTYHLKVRAAHKD